MFDNIGEKIKSFAKAIVWIVGIISVILGIGVAEELDSIVISIIVILLGILIGWIVAIGVYGLGQLIENSDKLVENSEKIIKIYHSGVIEKKLNELQEKLNNGEITQADYDRQKSALLWAQF